MANVFQQINGPVSEEQITEIVKTGKVPSHLKTAEDKVYYVIFRNFMFDFLSSAAEDFKIDGEVIITVGRYETFKRIKKYLENDGELGTDFRYSTVMVEGVDAAKGISLYRFIKLCNKAYPNEAFDEEELEERTHGFIDDNSESNSINRNKMATGFGGNAGTMLNDNKEE